MNTLKNYTKRKPVGTFYTDYVIHNGVCYAIFEHDVRRTIKKVCKTSKLMVEDYQETDKILRLTL